MKILLVEDDPQVGQSLCRALKDENYSVDWVRDGNKAQSAIKDFSYLIVLLDLGLPGASGFEVLRNMRANSDGTPVLIITAQADIDARVTGLDLGADDYLLKPFELKELMARVRAVVRRKAGHADSHLGDSNIKLDLNTCRLTTGGRSEVLSAKEFALMRALLDRPNAILSRAQLEERLYGWGEEVASNAVDVLIYYVRKKFGAAVVRNVRGLGWTVPVESEHGSNTRRG
jgi:two-component system, OmpR family, response regulator